LVVFSIFSAKKYMTRDNTNIFMFIGTTVLYECMNSPRNYVNMLFGNTHVRIKIYWKFYHSIVYIANEGRHVRIFAIFFCCDVEHIDGSFVIVFYLYDCSE